VSSVLYDQIRLVIKHEDTDKDDGGGNSTCYN
jgi:hypothetical protein